MHLSVFAQFNNHSNEKNNKPETDSVYTAEKLIEKAGSNITTGYLFMIGGSATSIIAVSSRDLNIPDDPTDYNEWEYSTSAFTYIGLGISALGTVLVIDGATKLKNAGLIMQERKNMSLKLKGTSNGFGLVCDF